MSRYGGDSWSLDASKRKERVENLLLGESMKNEFRKLQNGKFLCLLCPQETLLDTAEMLAVHRNGKRHQEELLKQKRQAKQSSKGSAGTISSSTSNSQMNLPSSKRLAVSSFNSEEAFPSRIPPSTSSTSSTSSSSSSSSSLPPLSQPPSTHYSPFSPSFFATSSSSSSRKRSRTVTEATQDVEKELTKLLGLLHEKGWRRDEKGNFFKDEEVEFDSDEEQPEIPFHLREYISTSELEDDLLSSLDPTSYISSSTSSSSTMSIASSASNPPNLDEEVEEGEDPNSYLTNISPAATPTPSTAFSPSPFLLTPSPEPLSGTL